MLKLLLSKELGILWRLGLSERLTTSVLRLRETGHEIACHAPNLDDLPKRWLGESRLGRDLKQPPAWCLIRKVWGTVEPTAIKSGEVETAPPRSI
jgi:hypothetical protein